MKMYLNDFKELTMAELLSVNGGYTTTAYYPSSSGGYKETSVPTDQPAPPHSKVPEGYSPTSGWLPGWDENGYHGDEEEESGSEADEIDRTNSTYVKESLSNIGFRLLSEENTNGYAAGSERKYYQEIFESLKNNPDFNTSTKEIPIEGSPSAGFGHENVTEYMISSNGNIQMRVIDVNNDGKVDYVYKY